MKSTRFIWSYTYKYCNDCNPSMIYLAIFFSFFTILCLAFYIFVSVIVKFNEAHQFLKNDHGSNARENNDYDQIKIVTPSINSGPPSSLHIKPKNKGKNLDDDPDDYLFAENQTLLQNMIANKPNTEANSEAKGPLVDIYIYLI